MTDFHPIVVHFTIGLLAVGVVLDLLSAAVNRSQYRQTASLLLGVGTACALVAVLTGLRAADMAEIPPEALPLVEAHKQSGIWTLVGFVLVMITRIVLVKRQVDFRSRMAWGYHAAAVIALILLFRTGSLGGDMVYRYGIGTEARPAAPAETEKPAFE